MDIHAAEILRDCLVEAGDDLEAGLLAAECILSAEDGMPGIDTEKPASFYNTMDLWGFQTPNDGKQTLSSKDDYPRNNSNQFLDKHLIAEAARDDMKYAELRDSIPEDQRWKLDRSIGILLAGGIIHHPSEQPELGINLQGESVNPALAKYESDKAAWEARSLDRAERRKLVNKAVRSFRSEAKPLDRIGSLLKKAGATRADVRQIVKLRHELDKGKIPPAKFDRLYEELMESIHSRLDKEEADDIEPTPPSAAFGELDRRGVEHRAGGEQGGQFVHRGADDSSKTDKEKQRRTKLHPDADTQKKQQQAAAKPLNDFMNGVHSSLVNRIDLTPEQRQSYAANIQSVMGKMSPGAQERVMKNVKEFNWYVDTQEITDNLAGMYKNFAAIKAKGGRSGGAYVPSSGAVHLDGDEVWPEYTVKATELYAHELTHAIDGPKFEYSTSPEWMMAWTEEIGNQPPPPGQRAKLTVYATTSAKEGFAEFGRLLFASNWSRQNVERSFPKCVAVWKKAGIWQ